jgi:hypothetical protein
LRAGRASGTWCSGGADRAGVAGDARLATDQDEEIKAIGGRHARRNGSRQGVRDIVAELDDFLRRDAHTADRDTVDDGPRVGDLTNDGAAGAVRLSDDADGLRAAIEGRHDGREAVAIGVRDRDHDIGVDPLHGRPWDVADQRSVADTSGPAGAVDDDRVA